MTEIDLRYVTLEDLQCFSHNPQYLWKRIATQCCCDLAFNEETFWSLVGANMTSAGWDTDSNILPPKKCRVQSRAWGENTCACFKGKCLAL